MRIGLVCNECNHEMEFRHLDELVEKCPKCNSKKLTILSLMDAQTFLHELSQMSEKDIMKYVHMIKTCAKDIADNKY